MYSAPSGDPCSEVSLLSSKEARSDDTPPHISFRGEYPGEGKGAERVAGGQTEQRSGDGQCAVM